MPQSKIDYSFLPQEAPKIDYSFLEAKKTVPVAKQPAPTMLDKIKMYAREGILGAAEGVGIDPAAPVTSTVKGLWNMGNDVLYSGANEILGGFGIKGPQRYQDAEQRLLGPNVEQFQQAREYGDNLHLNPKNTDAARFQALQDFGGEAFHAAAGLVPIVGPAAANIVSGAQTALENHDPEMVARSVGKGVGLLASMKTPEILDAVHGGVVKPLAEGIGKGTSSIATRAQNIMLGVPPTTEAAIIKSIKPKSTNIEFKSNLKTVVPEIFQALKNSGIDLSTSHDVIQDLITAVQNAKKGLWAQRSEMLGDSMSHQVDGTPVADAMRKAIPTKTWIQNPELAQRMSELADTYAKPHNLSDLEDMLHTTNAELNAYYDKYPTARRASAAKNPDTAGLFAEGDALRKLIYGHVDPQGMFGPVAEASRRYGKLLNFEEELYRRKNVFDRQQPNSLQEQMGKLGMAKEVGKGAAKVIGGIATGNPAIIGAAGFSAAKDFASAYAIKKMSDFLKERGSAQEMLRKAFTDPTIQPPVPLSAPFSNYMRKPLQLPAAGNPGVQPSSGMPFHMPSNLDAANAANDASMGRQAVVPTSTRVSARLIPRLNDLGSGKNVFEMPKVPISSDQLQLPAHKSFEMPSSSLKDLNVTSGPAKSKVIRDARTGKFRKIFTNPFE